MKRLLGSDKMAIVEYGLIVALILVAALTGLSALTPNTDAAPPNASNIAG